MEQTLWQDVAPVTPTLMTKARRQAHNALHWMARIANSYAPPQPENRHLELQWHDATSALRTQTFCEDLTVECRLGQLELQFCEAGQPVPHVFSFEEHTPAHIEAWFLVELLHRGVDRSSFTKDLPYEERDLMLGDHEEHSVEEHAAELAALDAWMRNAAVVAKALRSELVRDGDATAEQATIVCWPETFQIGIELRNPQASASTALRAGLSGGDTLRPDPFFFVGSGTESQSANFDAASILSTQRIVDEKLAAQDVIGFLKEQLGACRKRTAH